MGSLEGNGTVTSAPSLSGSGDVLEGVCRVLRRRWYGGNASDRQLANVIADLLGGGRSRPNLESGSTASSEPPLRKTRSIFSIVTVASSTRIPTAKANPPSASYLFVPLAEAVVFAMLASYVLSRTLVPTLAMYLLKAKGHGSASRNLFGRIQHAFERGFERVRAFYQSLLTGLLANRKLFIPGFLGLCLGGFLLLPWLGQDFFPDTDSGQFILHVRGRTGLRIEETARLFDLVEDSIRQTIPPAEMDNILDDIGLPYSPYNTMHSTSGVLGASDGDVLVSLRELYSRSAFAAASEIPRSNFLLFAG